MGEGSETVGRQVVVAELKPKKSRVSTHSRTPQTEGRGPTKGVKEVRVGTPTLLS